MTDELKLFLESLRKKHDRLEKLKAELHEEEEARQKEKDQRQK